jgi:hypothetical protein
LCAQREILSAVLGSAGCKRQEIRVFMALWLVPPKEVPPVIVEAAGKPTGRLARREIRQTHSV